MTCAHHSFLIGQNFGSMAKQKGPPLEPLFFYVTIKHALLYLILNRKYKHTFSLFRH
jgi:hypothetical protein